jgi:hypothetical protein
LRVPNHFDDHCGEEDISCDPAPLPLKWRNGGEKIIPNMCKWLLPQMEEYISAGSKYTVTKRTDIAGPQLTKAAAGLDYTSEGR